MSKVLFKFAVVLSLVAVGSGIRCYICTYTKSDNIGDQVLSHFEKSRNAPDDLRNCTYCDQRKKVFPTEECPNGACFSIVSHRNDKKYETKGCTTDLSQKQDEFVHFDSDNSQAIVYFCKSDLCNGAGTKLASFAAIVMAVIVAFV